MNMGLRKSTNEIMLSVQKWTVTIDIGVLVSTLLQVELKSMIPDYWMEYGMYVYM